MEKLIESFEDLDRITNFIAQQIYSAKLNSFPLEFSFDLSNEFNKKFDILTFRIDFLKPTLKKLHIKKLAGQEIIKSKNHVNIKFLS